MKLPIHIETHDRMLPYRISDSNEFVSGAVLDVPGGAKVEMEAIVKRHAIDIPEILQIIVEVSATVDLGLFTAWLYDKVKDKPPVSIRVRHTEITEITEDAIRQTIEKEIEVDQ